MINIKNAQFTNVKNHVKDICPDCNTIEQNTPTVFPSLLFRQMDNPSYKNSQDSDSKENHVRPMIQIDIYTANNNMYQAEQIMNKADEQMQTDGWERTFGPQPIKTSSTYAQLTARYQGIVRQNAPNDFTVI